MTTIKQAKAILKPLGITLRKDPFGGDYRINFAFGSEASAYYTDDREDAISTGRAMAARVAETTARLATKKAAHAATYGAHDAGICKADCVECFDAATRIHMAR